MVIKGTRAKSNKAPVKHTVYVNSEDFDFLYNLSQKRGDTIKETLHKILKIYKGARELMKARLKAEREAKKKKQEGQS